MFTNLKQQLLVGLVLLATPHVVQGQEPAAEKITYDDHAKAILVQRCGSCHGGGKKEGGLDVTNYLGLMQGGGSGAVVEPTDAGGSYLYRLITHEDSPEMPPSGVKIPDPEIQLLGQWISMGALENMGSKAAKPKPKLNMVLAENPSARPEVLPEPFHLPLEPSIVTERPSVLAIATNPWAAITALSTPKQILLYNNGSMELAGVLPFPEGVAHSLRFSRNGQLLLAGGGQDGALGKTILFDARTGERITTVGDELETVLAADISPSQEYIAFGGPNKLVKLCYADGTLISEINKHTDWVTSIAYSPDGKYFASGDRNGGLLVWDGETGDPIATLGGHTGQITGISWRADSLFLASASEDTTVKVWETKDWKPIKSWGAHGGGVTAIEYRRDGNLVTAGRDNVAKAWDQDGKMLTQYAGLPDVAVAVSNCDESGRVIAADWSGQVWVWNSADGAHLGNLNATPPTLATRLAQAEQQLAAATQTHQPLAEQLAQTKSAVEVLAKTLAEKKQLSAEVETRLAAEQQQLAAMQQQLDATTTKLQQEQGELDLKNKAKPLVAESFAKANEALITLPTDEQLKNAVAALQQKIAEIDARIGILGGLVQESTQQISVVKVQMTEMTATVTASQTQMESVKAEVTQMDAQMATMVATMAQQEAATTAAAQELQLATTSVSKWQSEIAFVGQLTALKGELSLAGAQLAERQAAVEAAHLTLIQAQQQVDQAKQQQAEVQQQADAIQGKISELRGG